MIRKIGAIAGLVIVPMTCGDSFAGAWTAPAGSFYGKMTLNRYAADETFGNGGGRKNFSGNGEFTESNINFYVEYGLFDQLTMLGSVTCKKLSFEDENIESRADGLSDIDLGLKYGILKTNGGVLSVQGLVKIPGAYDEKDPMPLGNGQYDVEARILYGHSLRPLVPGYVNLEAGYRFRAEEPADEFRYLVEAGVDLSDSIYGRIKLDGIVGTGNSDDSASPSNPSAAVEYDLGKLDCAIGWKISPNWGVEAGYRPDIYGKNTTSGANWSVGVICMF